ncbi:M16 family metallopeptidase [Pelagibacterium halotolerans]|uniref:M16 family metallopeptidase n=1 Tax=Pelagibacterium halotolerans TaxID=531813 RepID=UPI00385038F8
MMPSQPHRGSLRARSVLVLAVICMALLAAAGFATFRDDGGPDIPGVHVISIPDSNRVTAHVIVPQLPAPAGLAHYTEHLAWLNAVGEEKRDADRHSNAWTNDYAIGYWLSGAPADLPDILRTLKGVFAPLEVPEDFAEDERGIIQREYEYRVVNNPDAQAGEVMDAFLYEGNAIAASVIGTPQDIAALDYDNARALHVATHVPQDARLVVVGGVSEGAVLAAMREAGWPEADTDEHKVAPPQFDLDAPATRAIRHVEADAAPRLVWRRVVTLPEPVPFDLLEARTALLRDILDTNLPGGLAGPLRFDTMIASSFGIEIWPIDEDNIELSFRAAPDRDVSLAMLQDAFETTLEDIARNGIPQTTWSRILGRFDGFWPDWADADETADWMAAYVLDRISTLREPLSAHELDELKPALTLASTNALLRALAGEGRTAVAFIGPEERFE